MSNHLTTVMAHVDKAVPFSFEAHGIGASRYAWVRYNGSTSWCFNAEQVEEFMAVLLKVKADLTPPICPTCKQPDVHASCASKAVSL